MQLFIYALLLYKREGLAADRWRLSRLPASDEDRILKFMGSLRRSDNAD